MKWMIMKVTASTIEDGNILDQILIQGGYDE